MPPSYEKKRISHLSKQNISNIKLQASKDRQLILFLLIQIANAYIQILSIVVMESPQEVYEQVEVC